VEAAKHELLVLDMGPGSVDGWLAGLVAHELGIERADLLDVVIETVHGTGTACGETDMSRSPLKDARP